MQSEQGDDVADEVKVFRRSDAEEDDIIAETSERLDEDKKEAAKETELETSNAAAEILGRSGAFKPAAASPTFHLGSLGMMPSFPFAPQLSPAFLPFGMLTMPQMVAQHRAALSPFFPMAAAAAPLSPGFYNAFNPNTLLQNALLASPGASAQFQKIAAAAGMQLPPNMRPLGPMSTNVRMPGFGMQQGSKSMPNTPKRNQETSQTQRQDRRQHIKKPLNAFMFYMKENRAKLMAELSFKEKQSAELNKELGRRWQTLPKEEQQPYFEMARKAKDEHQMMYPGWTARDNYAINKKKKRKREKPEVVDLNEAKKCRARFGVDNQEQWCRYCKRKKKCQYTTGIGDDPVSRSSSSTEPSLPGDGSHMFADDHDELKGRFLLKSEAHDENDSEEDDTDDEMDYHDLDDMEDEPTLTASSLSAIVEPTNPSALQT